MNNYKKFNKLRNESSTFCILPFTHLNLQIHGNSPKASSCWEQMTLTDDITDNYSVKDAWNSKIFCDIRKDTLSNKRHDACQQCWHREDSGANGFRISHLRSYINPFNKFDDNDTRNDEGCFDILETYNFETGEIDFSKLPFIELRFGRQCNLMCRMCHAGESSQWDLGLRQNKELYDWTINNGPYIIPPPYSPIVEKELLKKQIDIIIDSCKDNVRTIMFAGGEPLLSKDHYALLEKLQPNAHNIRLKYSSNFNILNIKKYNLFKLWKSFHAVEVKISHDVDPHVYNYLRYKGDYKIVRENIEDLHKENLSNVEITCSATTSIYNMPRIVETFQYFTDLNCYIHSSIVTEPDYLCIKHLPQELKDQINYKLDNFNVEFKDELFWTEERKHDQYYRINKESTSLRNYMNNNTQNIESWNKFFKFDDIFSQKKNSILDIYPEWEKFLPKS